MKRKLGHSGIDISALGMGCWAIGGPFWAGKEALGWSKVDDAESKKALQKALDLGITFFDTADVYGAGHSERILGETLKNKRKEVVIATKFGIVFDESSKQVTGTDASPAYIKKACEHSLKRLDTDYIDLYQFHLNDYPAEESDDILDTLELLVDEGKIRTYGWSTDFEDRAQKFSVGDHCVAIQHQENVLDDNEAVITLCESENLASINRGPLAMGLLTGKYKSGSSFAEDDVRGQNSPEWMKYFKKGEVSEEWLGKVEKIRKILLSDGRSLVQGAIGWLWARSTTTIPIPGFKTVNQVIENAGAIQWGPLSENDFLSIQKLLDRK